MTRLPSKASLAELWSQDYNTNGFCCLCGNHGIIDNRGKIFAPNGIECGARVFCICPNGQIMKKKIGTLPH